MVLNKRVKKNQWFKTCFLSGLVSLVAILFSKLPLPPFDYLSWRKGDVSQYFWFPDSDSLYFKTNVKGIIASIHRAFSSCPDIKDSLSALPERIEIIFESRREPSLTKYVQFQMEQFHSPLFQDEQYLSKLRMASQIWEFSDTNAKKLSRLLNMNSSSSPNLYVIPMMLTYQASVGMYSRKISMQEVLAQHHLHKVDIKFTSFTRHCYVQWKVKGQASSMVSQADRLEKSPCGQSKCELEDGQTRHFSLNQEIDILIFGVLSCSHNNKREQICALLEDEGFQILCLHQVFGILLEHFITHAKVILNVEFYKDSSLATHRIDPLVLNGKVVVSLNSSDASLDELYKPLVKFTTETSLISDLRRVLALHKTFSREMSSRHIKQYISSKLLQISPLCKALRAI